MVRARFLEEESLNELRSLESKQELNEKEEGRLRKELQRKRQELSKSESRGEVFAKVAHGVSELAKQIAAQESRSKTEIQSAESKVEMLKINAQAKAQELETVKGKIHQSRKATDSECKELMQETRDYITKISRESREKDEEMQEELTHLERKIDTLRPPNEQKMLEAEWKISAQEKADLVVEHREVLHGLRRELQQLKTSERKDERRLDEDERRLKEELHAAEHCRAFGVSKAHDVVRHGAARELSISETLDSARELAKSLASRCEQSWKRLSDEKQKAALTHVKR